MSPSQSLGFFPAACPVQQSAKITRHMQWFEDEAFWRELYPYLFTERRFASAPAEVDQVLALANFQGSAVLDLCCGPGRHAVELAKRGYSVTGVDRTAFLLERARERADKAAAAVEWVQQDMRDFARPNAFDLALSMFTSFGYFENPDQERRVLQNVWRSLRTGGALVMEMAGKERLAKILSPTTSQEFPDGAILFERHKVCEDWTRVSNDWTLVKGSQARTFRLDHFVYSGRELKTELLASGFTDVRLFGDLLGNPYDADALRLVAVARK